VQIPDKNFRGTYEQVNQEIKINQDRIIGILQQVESYEEYKA